MEEFNLNASTENSVKQISKKKNTKAIIISIIGVVLFFIFIAVMASGGGSGGKLEVVSSKLDYDYNEYIGYDITVSGTLKNNTSIDYSYVSIEFSVYDASGNNIGSVFDNISNLGAGETWSFSASLLYTDEQPVSYKLVDITKW